jgi:molybdenum cofactor cytidylyltransferase
MVVGVLLAAGAGRRYGKPKVLVEGWLQTAVGALRDGGCAEVVLVLGAAEVPAPPGVTAITAPDWDEGLSASVRAGLLHAEGMDADYAVLHVIDTPDVGPAVVARVLGRALASGGGLARTYFGDRPGHPVVIGRQHLPAVLAQISGDQGAGSYLRSRRDVEIVDCADLAGGWAVMSSTYQGDAGSVVSWAAAVTRWRTRYQPPMRAGMPIAIAPSIQGPCTLSKNIRASTPTRKASVA